LLRALQRAANIENVLQHEVAGVDQDASAILCQDGERRKYGGRERFGDGARFYRVAGCSEVEVAAD
jgi:hypothetical protein